MAAALASVVARSNKSSIPPSETRPDPTHAKLAKANVKAWRKGKGEETGAAITGEFSESLMAKTVLRTTRQSYLATGNLGTPRPQSGERLSPCAWSDVFLQAAWIQNLCA